MVRLKSKPGPIAARVGPFAELNFPPPQSLLIESLSDRWSRLIDDLELRHFRR